MLIQVVYPLGCPLTVSCLFDVFRMCMHSLWLAYWKHLTVSCFLPYLQHMHKSMPWCSIFLPCLHCLLPWAKKTFPNRSTIKAKTFLLGANYFSFFFILFIFYFFFHFERRQYIKTVDLRLLKLFPFYSTCCNNDLAQAQVHVHAYKVHSVY